jgi:hypothetical protein
MAKLATATDDITLIKTLIDPCPLYAKLYDDEDRQPLRNKEHFRIILDDALASNKTKVIIYISINTLHFDNPDFMPERFETIGITPYPRTAVPPPITGQTQGTLTPAFQKAFVDMINANAQGNNNSPLVTNANTNAGTSSVPANSVSNFNYRLLPKDVQDRYIKRLDDTSVITGSEMKRFNTNTPTTSDPSITRKANYHLDPPGIGPRLITRDGTYFCLNKQENTKEAARDKLFLSNMPSCKDSSPSAVRTWYRELTIYAASHGIYVHPYYCFRKNANHLRGFTAGEDTDTTAYDLPLRYIPILDEWGAKIYTALNGDKVFHKDKCDELKAIVATHDGGKGYEALYSVIGTDHPNNTRHSTDVIARPPTQRATESLNRYFFRYKDYLRLRAYLSNIATNLNDDSELDTFILGTRLCKQFRKKSDEERQSSDPYKRMKYTQGQILMTLTTFEREINAEEPATRTAPRLTPSTRGSRYERSQSSSRRSDRSPYRNNSDRSKTPSNVSVNIIDVIGDIDTPDLSDLTLEEQYVTNMYQAACYSVQSNPREFDLSNPCAVCHKPGHAFKDCPILKNYDYLVKHHIAFCLQMNKLKRIKDECTAKVSKIDTVSETTQPSDGVLIDDTSDFHSGQE